MTTPLIILALWIICGWLAYGLVFADSHRNSNQFDWRSEAKFTATVAALFGPVGLFAAMFTCRSGFMWRTPK